MRHNGDIEGRSFTKEKLIDEHDLVKYNVLDKIINYMCLIASTYFSTLIITSYVYKIRYSLE